MSKSASNKNPTLKKESSYEYKIGNYLIQQTLGQGTFGKVKLGIYLPTQEKVAIKILEKERMKDKDDQIRVKREFDMLSKFNHPNVILVTEIFESVDSYYSVMDYCEGGELFNYIVDKKRLSENETSFFYFQIINGLEYIHSLGIVHRDLKPENLLLTKDHLLKIIDFGLSNYFVDGQEELLSTPCGSPCYASPEMVSGKKYNGIKIDIWATGIILFAMLCGYLPFENKDNEILFDQILECKVEFPDYLSDESKDLISKILVVDPETRIDISGIKKHSFYLRGKNFFEQIFTIRKLYSDENENENENKNQNDLENNNENENNDDLSSNTIEVNEENKEKDEVEIEDLENKENINLENIQNAGKNEEILEKNSGKNKKVVNKDKKYKKEKKEESNNSKNKTKNDNIIKKSKDLIHKNLRQKDKKKKIDITDDNKNHIGYNKKKLSDLIPNNYNRKTTQKTPEKKNGKKIKIKESTIDKTQNIDSLPKERNTAFTLKGSSLIEHFNGDVNQTNLANMVINNMNYNVNISFDNTKRTYSHENTKDDIYQNKQSIKNNIINDIFHSNTNQNKDQKNNININIIDKGLNNDSNKNENKNNYLFNYNKKRYKNNIINKKYSKKLNHNSNVARIIKHSFNSDNLRMKNKDFRICKFLESDSNIKKHYKEFLNKEFGNSTSKYNKNILNNNNSVSKNKNSKYDYSYKNQTINCNSKSKDKQIYINKTNDINNYKNTSNNKENNLNMGEKKYFKKIQNFKKLKINSNLICNDKSIIKNKFISNTNNNSKNKSKIFFIKSSNANNKNNYKKINKLSNNNLMNQHSLEISDLYTNSNIKNILAKKVRKKTNSKLNSRTENKTLYPLSQNVKYSMNTLRKNPIYNHHYSYKIESPLRTGKYNQKVIRNNFNNKLINYSFKKRFDTSNNIMNSFKMNRSDLIGAINKTSQKKNEPQTKKDIREEISHNKLIEKTPNSAETNKNNPENEKQNSQSGISYIYNVSNDALSNHLKANDRKSSTHKENNFSKNKNILKGKINKNICSECDYDYEKNKILEMNKFRNLCIKTNSHLKEVKNDNKNYHTKTVRRTSNLNNYKDNILKLRKNISQKNLGNNINVICDTNKNHNKYNSMKMNDIYKNNIKNKNKLKKVYLIDNNKNNIQEEKIIENNKNSLANHILFQRHIISIENYDNNGNINIQYKISENNLPKKIRKQNGK